MRLYNQHCPLARSLDLVGERWTLLVLRELWVAPRRFSELEGALAGIGPNLLSARLKMLGREGLVERVAGDEPGSGVVYQLNPRGRDIEPVLLSLARFGWPLLHEADDASVPPSLLALMVRAQLSDTSLPDLVVEWRTGDATITSLATDGTTIVAGNGRDPDVVVDIPDAVFATMASRGLLLRDAIAARKVKVTPAAHRSTVRSFLRG